MSDLRSESEQPQPTQWIKPFIGYDQIPYSIDRDQYKTKSFMVDDVQIESIWDRNEIYDLESLEHPVTGLESVLYFDGREMKMITRNDVRDMERRDEVRLIDLKAGEKDGSQLLGYQIRFPNGSTFKRFYDLHDSNWVNTETEEEFEDFAIPETEFILSQIEISTGK